MLPFLPSPIAVNQTRSSSLGPNVFRRPPVRVKNVPDPGRIDSNSYSFQPEFKPADSTKTIDESSDKIISINIVGGSPVEDETTYPYFVHFVSADDKTCGASLIYEDILLTAASCAAAKSTNPFIGSVEWKGGTQLTALERLVHPEFNEISRFNDIMLVHIDASRNETPVVLATERPDIDETLRVMGFGLFNETEFSAILLETQVSMLEFGECVTVYSELLDETTQLCAGPSGSCLDDEGGPLMDATADIQYGIFSFTENCTDPQIYTDLTQYTAFIEEGICSLSSNPPILCPTPAPTLSVAPSSDSVAPSEAPVDSPVQAPVPPPPIEPPIVAPQPTNSGKQPSKKQKSRTSGKKSSNNSTSTKSKKASSTKSSTSTKSRKSTTPSSNKQSSKKSKKQSSATQSSPLAAPILQYAGTTKDGVTRPRPDPVGITAPILQYATTTNDVGDVRKPRPAPVVISTPILQYTTTTNDDDMRKPRPAPVGISAPILQYTTTSKDKDDMRKPRPVPVVRQR